jgi:hypothetical protein
VLFASKKNQTMVLMGAQCVFASKGKVYQIANQHSADLAAHPGHTVKLDHVAQLASGMTRGMAHASSMEGA